MIASPDHRHLHSGGGEQGWANREREAEHAHSRAHDAAPVVLEVSRATHRYGDLLALDDVSVKAREGEFLTLLGHSGSGKTTLLRIIAGLEISSEVERLTIDGEDMREMPANLRNCTTVFQQYALFPHMSVGQNVAYGLKVRGVGKGDRLEQAREALALVRLGNKFDRRINQLSGGERQRVALARALVTRPRLLLLDEPLGALDEKLRIDMQIELMHLHKKVGLTFVYVTHSQEEALTMSDRVILMRGGKIAQEGAPADLFDRPVDREVATFMGVENLLEARVTGIEGDQVAFEVAGQPSRGLWCGRGRPKVGAAVDIAVRAERLRFAAADDAPAEGHVQIPCSPGEAVYKGKYLDQTLNSKIGELKARLWDPEIDIDAITGVWWRPNDCAVMDKMTQDSEVAAK